jgi:TolB-like protein
VADVLEHLRSALGDRYDVERLLGEGGMATVFLAKDLRHGRQVAIKTLRAELAASIGADRFLREIQLAANLQHPNILTLYDSGEATGVLYYVMPFVEGESLRGRLEREQQLPLYDAVRITREAAEGLAYAHEHGVVHRDIKPENILLQNNHALVADFGIARAVDAAGEKLTQTGMAVGTPHYMSPEQALGSDHADGRSDIYSLGCVLYELLVGQPPFDGPNSRAIMARHSMEQVPSLQVVRQSVPDELEDVVFQSLEKTPADRFQTMAEFAEVLADLEPTLATRRTSSRGVQAVRRSSSRITRGGVSTVEAPAAESAAPTATVPAATTTKSRITPFAMAKGIRFWSAAGLVALAAVGIGVWRLRAGGTAPGATDTGLDPNRIAVLYFENRSGQDSLGYLADGLTDALIHELSGVQGLQTISSNGVRPYKTKEEPLASIAQDLKVGTVVQGDVTQAGDRLRVNVALVNPTSGVELGSKTLERPRSEIFALQDDLAREVADFLRQQLGQEVKVQEIRAGTRNAAAWELLQKSQAELRGAEPLIAAGDSAAAGRQLARADSLLARTESLDPSWVTPPTQRAWVAYRRARLGGSFDKSYYDQWTQVGLAHAEKAIQLNPNDPDALEARGSLRYLRWLLNLTPDPVQSAQLLADVEKDLRASVDRNPRQASAWSTLSHLLLTRSQTAEGKLAALRAYEADPYLTTANLTLWRLFESSLDLEDGVEAKHWCSEGQRRFPGDVRFVECQMRLLALQGTKSDVDSAWRMLDEYVKLYPPHQRAYRQLYGQMLVSLALARAGLVDSGRAVVERSRGDVQIDPARELTYLEVLFRTMVGDKDEAIRLLGTYLATNPQRREDVARDDSWWIRDLKKDPRFRTLVAQ